VEVAVGSWRALLSARASYGRIRDALARAGMPREVMELPPPRGRIAVENVIHALGPERRPVIKGISFELVPGDSLGIVGPAASGKSTLARLMLGVWAPTSGKVRLDGADVAQWPRESLGRHVGYLPQEVELFPGTVAENIARMESPDAEEVVAAARWARVHEMILRLPQGYDTRIMAGGLMLSPGQRQRIALARALYGDPFLIVLDEPHSNLDSEGEAALTQAIQAAKARKAIVIVIAHRPLALAACDKVLYLANGVQQAFGPRDEVLPKILMRTAPVPAAQAPFVVVGQGASGARS
jgi:ABC-type protease/lipase transport system fused ATPase/permease subunit